jgi:hypothetical protein
MKGQATQPHCSILQSLVHRQNLDASIFILPIPVYLYLSAKKISLVSILVQEE